MGYRRGRRSNIPRTLSWETAAIHKLLHSIPTDRRMSISSVAMNVLVSMMRDLTLKVLYRAKEILTLSKRKTLTVRTIHCALHLTMSDCGELTKHAIVMGKARVEEKMSNNTSIVEYDDDEEGGGGGSKKSKEVYIIKASKIRMALKRTGMFQRVEKMAMEYLAAVIEYIISEILELAFNSCIQFKKYRIMASHINTGIRLDRELDIKMGYRRGRRSNIPRTSSWETAAIHKLLKSIPTDRKMSISNMAMNVLVSMMRDLTLKVLYSAKELLTLSKRKTLTTRTIHCAIPLTMIDCGELTKHAIVKGMTRVGAYDDEEEGDGGGSKKSKEVYIIKASKIRMALKRTGMFQRVEKMAMEYLAAVIEYIISEVLELAYNSCIQFKKYRIMASHINTGIRSDMELDSLFKDVTIAQGGVHTGPVKSKVVKKSEAANGYCFKLMIPIIIGEHNCCCIDNINK
ncbi:hypothetical protein PPL_00136 [Heterostelium album PN500]|uniref:Histone H4 n=1 Tax=Heterostelium pallidum (strain ATCC 26659 / Pp 5 / PN500) TaxID=670386 RepID=D3AVM1_HETP5|nr:hypothetical protein PPL_00136 [Heterostelium album PN500]EFA86344.1 hypothetical protein PPL_00136 [Heterostelium album PN500]|eukprot:XP_020438449.1 hypothetical protein PPL_00136 [Heterostelium album PN500]